MDPLTIMTAMAVIGGLGRLGQAFFQTQAAQEKKEALNLEAEQELLQHQQKTLSNYDVLQKVIATQTAQATTRGYSLNSPSFEAIQRNTFNVSGREETNQEIEHNLFKENVDTERKNINTTLYAQLFGDAAETAADFAGLQAKMAKSAKK